VAALQGLEGLGQFTRQQCRPLTTEYRLHILQAFKYAMRRLIENQRTRLFLDRFQPRPAPDRLGRQKAFEDEPV